MGGAVFLSTRKYGECLKRLDNTSLGFFSLKKMWLISKKKKKAMKTRLQGLKPGSEKNGSGLGICKPAENQAE